MILAISEFGRNCDILVMKVFIDLKLINASTMIILCYRRIFHTRFALLLHQVLSGPSSFFSSSKSSSPTSFSQRPQDTLNFRQILGPSAQNATFLWREKWSVRLEILSTRWSQLFQNSFLSSTNYFKKACFTCARCKRPFPTGERVTFTGKNCLCQACIQVGKKKRAYKWFL